EKVRVGGEPTVRIEAALLAREGELAELEFVVLVGAAFALPGLDLLRFVLAVEDDLHEDRHLDRLPWADRLVLAAEIDAHRLHVGLLQAYRVVAGEAAEEAAAGRGREDSRGKAREKEGSGHLHGGPIVRHTPPRASP